MISIILLLTGCTKSQPVYNAGIYEGNSEGYYSNIHVSVTVDEYRIIEIQILDHQEIKILADIVFEELPPRIIKKNSTEVDAITGATYTSQSLLQAVEEALVQARLQGGE
jgi:uncharacterized protein with FMN-binding domain